MAISELKGDMISYPGDGLEIPAYLSRAVESDAPCVVVIHEVFALTGHIKTVTDRIAAAGFNAIAPNLFVRAPEPPPTEDTDIDKLRKAASSIPNDVAMADLQAAIDYMKGLPGIKPKFASVGFCMGGGLSYQLAAYSNDLSGAVVFYGRIPVELAPRIKCPILGNFGQLDKGIPPESVYELGRVLESDGKPADLKVYPHAKHAFFNDTRPASYSPDAAADAWQRTLNFLHTNLS